MQNLAGANKQGHAGHSELISTTAILAALLMRLSAFLSWQALYRGDRDKPQPLGLFLAGIDGAVSVWMDDWVRLGIGASLPGL